MGGGASEGGMSEQFSLAKACAEANSAPEYVAPVLSCLQAVSYGFPNFWNDCDRRRKVQLTELFWADAHHIEEQIEFVRDVWPTRISVPARDYYWVAGELSRRNKLPNAFLDRSRWLEPLYKNILQGGQHFHRSALNELL